MKNTKRSRLNAFRLSDWLIIALLFVIAFVTFYPFWNLLILSLNDPTDSLRSPLWLLPRVFTLQNYARFFGGYSVGAAAVRSVLRTVIGALASVLFTSMFSYGVSKSYLRGRKGYILYMLVTMYVSGGIIPTFILIKSLGLYQHFLVYIIPLLFSTYNATIMMTYFKSLPAELEESVKIDGGNDFVIFFRIVIPISMPMFATILLFDAVSQWNSWFDTLLYGGSKLMTLQGLLVMITRNAEKAAKLMQSISGGAAAAAYKPTIQTTKATATMVSALPIIMVYPFLQKYFVKGIMIGSLKG